MANQRQAARRIHGLQLHVSRCTTLEGEAVSVDDYSQSPASGGCLVFGQHFRSPDKPVASHVGPDNQKSLRHHVQIAIIFLYL